jgi:hypothetical protein
MLEPDVAGVVPVGDIHVVIGEKRTHGGPEQCREVPSQGGHQEHGRLRFGDLFDEVQEGRERGGEHDLLLHGRLLPAHDDRVDAERRTLVRETGTPDHLVAGRYLARQTVVGPTPGQVAQSPRGETGQSPYGGGEVPLSLVCLVEHTQQPRSMRARRPTFGSPGTQGFRARMARRHVAAELSVGSAKLPRKKEKGPPGGWRSLLETHQVLEGGFHSLWSVSILPPST